MLMVELPLLQLDQLSVAVLKLECPQDKLTEAISTFECMVYSIEVEEAKAAGATFGVSPGATERLLDACEANDLPLLPGAATATEAPTKWTPSASAPATSSPCTSSLAGVSLEYQLQSYSYS